MNNEPITVYIDPDLEDLIPGFLNNRKEDIEKLNIAFTNGDVDSLKSIGHSLKGVGGGYGFSKITEIGAKIEQYAKQNNQQPIKQLIDEFSDYLDRLEIVYQG